MRVLGEYLNFNVLLHNNAVPKLIGNIFVYQKSLKIRLKPFFFV